MDDIEIPVYVIAIKLNNTSNLFVLICDFSFRSLSCFTSIIFLHQNWQDCLELYAIYMSAYIIILALNSYSTCLDSSFILIPTVDTLAL